MTAFNYEVTRGDGSISIRLEGDLDMHLSPDLRRMFEEQQRGQLAAAALLFITLRDRSGLLLYELFRNLRYQLHYYS